MAITVADFQAFFMEKRGALGNYHCPVCYSGDFVLNGPPSVASVMTPPSEPHIAPNGYIGLTCNNCGRTDFFHEIQIRTF